jgi:hypothetical protein
LFQLSQQWIVQIIFYEEKIDRDRPSIIGGALSGYSSQPARADIILIVRHAISPCGNLQINCRIEQMLADRSSTRAASPSAEVNTLDPRR